jgi:hypothetical protein
LIKQKWLNFVHYIIEEIYPSTRIEENSLIFMNK